MRGEIVVVERRADVEADHFGAERGVEGDDGKMRTEFGNGGHGRAARGRWLDGWSSLTVYLRRQTKRFGYPNAPAEFSAPDIAYR